MSWLETLKNLDTETRQEVEIVSDATSSSTTELSESLTQQGAESAKSPFGTLLALLPPHHLKGFREIHDHIRNIGETTIEG
jgi:hypothetical protein